MSSEGGSGSGSPRAGRWADAAILPELPPPPAERIRVRGAQRLRVFNVDAPNAASRGGFDEAVAVAWARLPDGGWAALLGWLSGWHEHTEPIRSRPAGAEAGTVASMPASIPRSGRFPRTATGAALRWMRDRPPPPGRFRIPPPQVHTRLPAPAPAPR